MATDRQIEANRRNAERSSGPKSDSGKSRSRQNATKHGLAGVLPQAEADSSPEFLDRRAKWAAEHHPAGDSGHWAMDRAIVATFRIEDCERAFNVVVTASRERAALAWDEDRAIEAATTFGRLGKDPVLASRQLRSSLAGVNLLIEAWLGLIAALEVGHWSEAEVSRALDLLGVAPDLRSGQTLIDPFDETDAVVFRREVAFGEVERLESLRDESMAPLDEMDRKRALAGDLAVLSKPARLVLRYERDAWRRYNQAMKEVEASRGDATFTPNKVVDPRPVAVAPPPAPAPKPAAPAESKSERERRELRAEVAPMVAAVKADLRAMGFESEDEMLEELERRIEARERKLFPAGGAPAFATERTQFCVGLVPSRVAGR